MEKPQRRGTIMMTKYKEKKKEEEMPEDPKK